MDGLARDGSAGPVSRDQILRRLRGQGNIHFPSSADHRQDWQPYPVGSYSVISDHHTYTQQSMDGQGMIANPALGQIAR